MKRLILLPILMICFFGFTASAQDQEEKLNLPGDNLNLYAVLKLFQESETLESFEKKLNDSSSNINNLDLNGDNKIDYIRVVDNPEGDVHNISLKVAVNKDEEQNVAVFVVEKKSDGNVAIQLIGGEDLYGKDYIIEPNTEDVAATETPNPGYSGTKTLADGETVQVQQTTYAQIATWPVITYIYVPTYTVWSSPWYWNYYPTYWNPWRPFYWHQYYGYHYHWDYYYYGRYRRSNYYRVPGWRDHYYGGRYRSRSVFVQTRYRDGGYRRTYSRPQTARVGSANFRRDNPTAPSRNVKLPSFDKTGTPIRPKPGVGTRPGTTRPVNPGVTHPGTRPVKPAPGNDHSIRPGVKPVRPNPGTTKPVTPGVKPVRPVTPEVKPVRPSVQPDRPSTRPIRPSVQPERPSTRPVQTTRPSVQPSQHRAPAVRQQPARRDGGQ